MKKLLLFLLPFLCLTASAQTEARFYHSFGTFDVKLREDLVPITAGNFISLVDTQFYDGVIWHRIIDNFVIQSGDPTGTGSGGPGYTIPDEFHYLLRHYKRGIISMANSGPNTGGSQFFICMKSLTYLDSLHAVFGEVINGWDVIDSLEITPTDGNDRPFNPPVIDSIRILIPAFRPDRLENAFAAMGDNFPNPVSGTTTFTFGLKVAASPKIHIYNTSGQKLETLKLGTRSPGDHQFNWNKAKIYPSGVYFWQLEVPGFVGSKAFMIE